MWDIPAGIYCSMKFRRLAGTVTEAGGGHFENYKYLTKIVWLSWFRMVFFVNKMYEKIKEGVAFFLNDPVYRQIQNTLKLLDSSSSRKKKAEKLNLQKKL